MDYQVSGYKIHNKKSHGASFSSEDSDGTVESCIPRVPEHQMFLDSPSNPSVLNSTHIPTELQPWESDQETWIRDAMVPMTKEGSLT